jgi:diguanylate cyclase (GGDEF)-like protein/PAS domain S-box-containing protein
MQNALLDILILGLLVLLFGSIYRTRRTPRLRYWIAGWLFILAHFAFLLPNPASSLWLNLDSALGITSLGLGGVCFLLASSTTCVSAGPDIWMKFLLTVPVALYVFWAPFYVTNTVFLSISFALLECGVLFFVFRCWRRKPRVLIVSACCAAAAIAWATYDIVQRHEFAGIYPVLTQIYLTNAIVYWYGLRRRSMGVVTASVGLVAWGAVFPTATIMAALLPQVQVPGELWNLPKYFVEFGMILTLVEDQVIETTKQGEEYRLLFDGNPHPMWIFDQETLDFLKVNAAAIAHYGYSQEEFLSKSLRDIRPPEDIPRLEHRIKDAGENTLYSGPWTHIRKDGSRIQVETASHAIQFGGRPARFSLLQDITERQQLYERLVYQAHHDILTGLPNRLLLKDRMEQLLAAAERLGEPAAILCVDLDHFKQVNDTYGHHTGDICLQQVAASLRDKLRMTDTMARSGGEEFIVLLGQLKVPADAARVAQVLLDTFRQSLMIEGHTISLTASIGIAMYPADGTAAQDLWRLADSAMYRAKRAGGNQYIFASREAPASHLDAIELEIDRLLIGRAIEDQMPRD